MRGAQCWERSGVGRGETLAIRRGCGVRNEAVRWARILCFHRPTWHGGCWLWLGLASQCRVVLGNYRGVGSERKIGKQRSLARGSAAIAARCWVSTMLKRGYDTKRCKRSSSFSTVLGVDLGCVMRIVERGPVRR